MIFALSEGIIDVSKIPGVYWNEEVVQYDLRPYEEPSLEKDSSGKIIQKDWYTNSLYKNHSHIELMKPISRPDGSVVRRYAVRERSVGMWCVDIRTGAELQIIVQVIGGMSIIPPGPMAGTYNYPYIVQP